MRFKVTKVYIVDAESKAEAVEKVVKDPNSLEMVFVKEVYKSAWDQVKSQLTGN